jgi:acetyl esterase/lipase
MSFRNQKPANEGIPPIFINSAVNEEMYDDGRRFYEKAKAAGVDIVFREGPGMVHCYPLLASLFREATEAMNEIYDFIGIHS